MSEQRVLVFFYGSYINRKVLSEVNLVPERWEVGSLAGFELVVQPRANLRRSDRETVYGVIASATHAELNRLYVEHSQGVLGETYLPEAVLVSSLTSGWTPALCYISHSMLPRPAAADYLDRIVTPARELGFPEWYVQRIERWRA